MGDLVSLDGHRRTRRKAKARRRPAPTAVQWFERGCQAEAKGRVAQALLAYEQALDLDPRLAEAHINIGRLLHELNRLGAAESHYRLAIAARPEEPTFWFNLGVVLQDRGRTVEALAAYQRSLALDAGCIDTHFNMSGVLEGLGDERGALRHLAACRRLNRTRRAG